MCLQFLKRVDLKGAEVPAFYKVQLALLRALETEKNPVHKEKPQLKDEC